MKIQDVMELKIKSLNPLFMELINESHNHAVPENSETHFKLFMVSEIFIGLSRIQRQRKIYEILSEELKNGVHALTLRLLTPEEFKNTNTNDFKSPDCHKTKV